MRAKRVVVAMSGGVDSSVCAALLKDEGFDVVGITMQMSGPSDFKAEAAKKTADKLGIEHRLLNLRDIFQEKVIADFCEEYKAGRTPNPCIKCNKYIKFGALLKEARRLGADYIATGHYARIEFDKRRKRYLLKKGIDSRKDQSYFLYTLSQEQLKQALFPLGAFTKDRAREVAQEKGLAAAKSSESQEICFIPDNRYGEFLKEYIPERAHKPGSIVNKEGKVIGGHQGIIFYTIGQRKGIGIADREPLYVASIDRENNTIAVGKKKEVYSDELIADNVNFISVDGLEAPMKVEAKVRYLHPPASATVVPQDKDRVRVKFERPQWAITPGQAAVFYNGDTVVGGGRICSV
ncbi:MAG: tRNA 2-thiouridine(34) synthase MnmA [Candidatus Omnitrophica bacterium]|nr:tRNA 2-thiouridine(34) synthase MnmA [Candidatus Omnitrophota bacterium]